MARATHAEDGGRSTRPNVKDLRAAERAGFLRGYAAHTMLAELTHEDGSLARVYSVVYPNGVKFYALGFAGTAGKPAFHYSFKGQSAAETYAADFIKGRAQHAALVAEQKAKRGAWKTKLQVGTVLRESWGYDQTNIDYYQVIEVSASGRTCVIREIAARSVEGEQWATGSCWPLANEFIGAPMRKVIGQGDSVKVREWGSWARPWEPKADRWTAYA